MTLTSSEVESTLAGRNISAEFRDGFDELCVTVHLEDWLAAVTVARDELKLTYFDWLSAIDNGGDGFTVVLHVFRTNDASRLLLQTTVSAEQPTVHSITSVYRGASWHERETHEMFGIDFAGHPYLVPLLLPDGFEGHPLRKDFVLASRAAKAWPGAKEPGESDASGPPTRRKILPPGVPDPDTWGPRPPAEASP